MRCLGVLGGMSWESTLLYYRLVNQGVASRLGGLHSAQLLLYSVDFAPIASMQAAGDWAAAAAALGRAGAGLRAAGAEGLLLATNTMHKLAPAIESASALPLLHIADATGAALAAAGIGRAALLGTRYTMEDPTIVRQRLHDRHGIDTLTPDEAGRDLVHRVIYDELCRGIVRDASRAAFTATIEQLARRGAEAVILGCTEITMLVDDAASPLPVFDSTALHAGAAVQWMLEINPNDRGDR